MEDSDWKIYRADGKKVGKPTIEKWLKTAPPWRRPDKNNPPKPIDHYPELSDRSERRGETYVSSSAGLDEASGRKEETQINIALMLRRPLLVKGPPGIGKSSLAYHLAWALELGEPLRWEINSRTTLQDGLYNYDAVDHLRSIQEMKQGSDGAPSLGEFITLGPLGTALLPTEIPRVLLVDELDKASFDLPNDLLHVFEEGEYVLPELLREGGAQQVRPWDSGAKGASEKVAIADGKVRTLHHPVVVITNNGERDFPKAFMRRCVSLPLETPGPDHMEKIVKNQLQDEELKPGKEAIDDALGRYKKQSTDVILQALFLGQGFDVPAALAETGLKRD